MVYLLNAAARTDNPLEGMSPGFVEKLAEFVKNGGGVGFFLGESVNVDYYNQTLYVDGRGVFPVPLQRPTEPLTDQQKFERTFDANMPPKLFAQ